MIMADPWLGIGVLGEEVPNEQIGKKKSVQKSIKNRIFWLIII